MISELDVLITPDQKREWCPKGANLLFVHRLDHDEGDDPKDIKKKIAR